MIEKALQFTQSTLNQYIVNKLGLDDTKVVINSLVDSNGIVPTKNENKVVLSLINVERETAKPFYIRHKKQTDGNYSHFQTVERYNLYLLCTSNFDDYRETLKFLDELILFFQVHASIDSSSFSNIPSGLDKLEFEIEKINYLQIHSLWNALGAKYQPSVIYKMRLVTMNPHEIDGFEEPVLSTSENITPNAK